MIAAADGCKAGWVVAFAHSWPCVAAPRLTVCDSFVELLYETAGVEVLTVDMPVGLAAGREPRRCDVIGRGLLRPEGAVRLFFAPPRPALAAPSEGEDSPERFQVLHRSVTGKGAGLPVWGL